MAFIEVIAATQSLSRKLPVSRWRERSDLPAHVSHPRSGSPASRRSIKCVAAQRMLRTLLCVAVHIQARLSLRHRRFLLGQGYLVMHCQLDSAVLAGIRGRPEELVRQTAAARAAAGES
jgi:hypothetical protein